MWSDDRGPLKLPEVLFAIYKLSLLIVQLFISLAISGRRPEVTYDSENIGADPARPWSG